MAHRLMERTLKGTLTHWELDGRPAPHCGLKAIGNAEKVMKLLGMMMKTAKFNPERLNLIKRKIFT